MIKTPPRTPRKRKSTRSAKPRPIRPRKNYSRHPGGGLTLEGEVSPCVFMYPGYPLQVTVTLRQSTGEWLGIAYAADRSKTAGTATEADVLRLLKRIRIAPCRQCQVAPAFVPQSVETNRGGLCESCFLHGLEAQWAREEEAERQALAERDRRMKADGMRVRVSAWVHPEDGGDDELVHWYFTAAPTREQIRALLREAGSGVLDDYHAVVL